MMYGFAVACTLLSAARGMAQERPAIDGRFEDWNWPASCSDPAGDAGAGRVDFRGLWIENDAEWLYLRFDTQTPLLLQENNNVTLWIDTDANGATGARNGQLGAELVWRFGARTGTVTLGTSTTISHHDISLVAAPSMTSTHFELAIRRDAMVAGRPLFPGTSIRIVLADAGDRLPDGDAAVSYQLHPDAFDPVAPIGVDPTSGALRLVAWNSQFGGMFEPVRSQAFGRVLRALTPDVMVFCEVFDQSAGEVLGFVTAALPPPSGRAWSARKVDAGNVLVTHLPIVASAAVQANYRESAFLLGRPDGGRLLVIAAHLRCCSADAERQKESDGVISFLRNAREGRGPIDLTPDIPVVMAGDFNLVGDARQLATLVTGAIMDTLRYGPSSPPDNGTSPFTVLHSRSPRTLFAQTWDDPAGSYAPGILDYILYTASTVGIPHHLVFRTDELSTAECAALGVMSADTRIASDHLPRVADLVPHGVSDAAAIPHSPSPTFMVWPQPARHDGRITLAHGLTGRVTITITDLLGRVLLAAIDEDARGGTQIRPGQLAPGACIVRVHSAAGMRQRVMVVQ